MRTGPGKLGTNMVTVTNLHPGPRGQVLPMPEELIRTVYMVINTGTALFTTFTIKVLD
jgi:hypothetical protein